MATPDEGKKLEKQIVALDTQIADLAKRRDELKDELSKFNPQINLQAKSIQEAILAGRDFQKEASALAQDKLRSENLQGAVDLANAQIMELQSQRDEINKKLHSGEFFEATDRVVKKILEIFGKLEEANLLFGEFETGMKHLHSVDQNFGLRLFEQLDRMRALEQAYFYIKRRIVPGDGQNDLMTKINFVKKDHLAHFETEAEQK